MTHLCDDIPEWKVAVTGKSGANAEELELAFAWAYGESDVVGEARLPLTALRPKFTRYWSAMKKRGKRTDEKRYADDSHRLIEYDRQRFTDISKREAGI